MRNPKLIDKFTAALPAPARRLLDEFLRIAERHCAPLYLVGGPLRDLLLERPSLDIDIAVEGDAISIARRLAEATGGRVVAHRAFLTAKVRLPGFRLDLITARSETYTHPGALPTVKPATIRDDLLRRDFTINAIALRLNGRDAGEILDPANGQCDLDARLIRVLHERSFQDDATRILRAFRYATRLGFEIEPETLAWIARDLRYLDTISGARLHHEFARIFAEHAPEDIVLPLHQTGALCDIHPALSFARGHAEAFAHLRELDPTGPRSAYWPVLASELTESEAASLARRLAATKPQREAMLAMPALRELSPRLRRDDLKRSIVAEMLSSYPLPALWAFAALTDDPTAREGLRDYLTKARHERPHLTGDDLIAMGIPRGPAVGEILRRLRNARLDGETTTREDETRLARGLVAASDKADHQTTKAAPSRSS
jgi:tRNA nucleotidyltransferase (CCA-adding enzyme)